MRVRRQVLSEALIALGLTLLVVAFTTVAALGQPDAKPLDVLGYGLLLAAGLPLLLRSRFPLSVFTVSIACALAYYWSGYPGGPAILLPALALFTVTLVRGPLVAGLAGAVLLVAGYVAFVVAGLGWLPDARAAGFAAGVAAVIGTGTAVRNRKAALRAGRLREEEHRYRLAEQERLSIAREVHDVVAHSLAVINVQAGVAAHIADRKPEQAVRALRDIKDASATALADLRATVSVLRSGDLRAPAPSLRQLPELIEHARAAGLTVDVRGEVTDLPAVVDAAAYRIVQESLTNIVRHANGASNVEIEIETGAGGLELIVHDDGAARVPTVEGNGIRGMRERAEALGGSVTAGPGRQRSGFEVRAVLPSEGTPA